MVRSVPTEPVIQSGAAVESYHDQLNRDARWALSEGSQFFEEKGKVQSAFRKITQKLNELRIPYAVVGGLALFKHGHRRFTEDVDLLVTKEGLRQIHSALDGLGWVPPFKGSKHLKDAELGVKIEFLTTGDFPGDGKPKPVAFPDPSTVSIEADGIHYLNLPTLIELKLASGMTNPGRLKDLGDVLELIKILNLPLDFGLKLNPYVQGKFNELWRSSRRRFVRLWELQTPKGLPTSIEEIVASSPAAAIELESMRRDGVTLDKEAGLVDGSVHLVTFDPVIARKYDMHDESEF